MATVYAVVGGTAYNLTDGTVCYFMGQDGLGMTPLHRLRERGAQQHGETDLGFRLDPRQFTLLFGINASSLSDLWDKRATLLNYFRPHDSGTLAVRLALDNGATRQIDAVYVGALQMPTTDRQGFFQRVAVNLEAPYPVLYDPTEQEVTWALAALDNLTFPIAFDIVFGSGVISETETIAYIGTWDSFPIIEITGPLNGPVVTNETTGDVLDLSGYNVAAGETVTIDTRYGYKSVVNNFGTNLIDELTEDSDLATFRLVAPVPPNTSRDNLVNVVGAGAVAAQTQIKLRYYLWYVGT
ncbi:MAG: phage tail family protein [Chloroflexi bacterium]|nr:phage tail family protein [Chloroflexota bacterium]